MSGRNIVRLVVWLFIILLCFRIHSNNAKLRRMKQEHKMHDSFNKCINSQLEFANMLENTYYAGHVMSNAVNFCKTNTGLTE